MPKKILDIFPPKKLPTVSMRPPPEIKVPPESPSVVRIRKKDTFKKGLISFLIILFLVILSCYFTLPRAEIEIWPETEIMNFKEKVTIDKEAGQILFQEKIIPGEIIEVEKSLSHEFPSSGKILKKAEGTIRLYNAYTTNSEVWGVGTRFVSANGKLFKSKSKISVPGAKSEKGKLIPSHTDVEVIAAEAGEEYNISPTGFSIYVYRGTARYTGFYGESFLSMTGGGEASQVTQEDLDQAKEILVNRVFDECQNSLTNNISEEFILLEGASETKALEASSLAKAGVGLENFIFQVKAKSEALVFKSEDLENFTKEYILSQVPEGKKIHEESLEINFSPKTINLESGEMILNLEFSAKIYADINMKSLKQGLLGKTLAATQIFLENQPQVTKVQVDFWPFWVKSIPEDVEKIKIKLNLDTSTEAQHQP